MTVLRHFRSSAKVTRALVKGYPFWTKVGLLADWYLNHAHLRCDNYGCWSRKLCDWADYHYMKGSQ